jgi:hypothetical protein
MVLSTAELRAVTAYAAECAQAVLKIFEGERPDDPRPRAAIDAAWEFARGGARGKALRNTAWAALKAANDTDGAAREAARSAAAAAGAAYLHPLPHATQVKHILGAAAHAARAVELTAGDPPEHIAQAARRATPTVVAVLRRYPPAPTGGGRVGELIRVLDGALRPGNPRRTGRDHPPRGCR